MKSKFFGLELCLLVMILFGSSCANIKDIAYMQDAGNSTKIRASYEQSITLKPDDKVLILVNCRDPQIAAVFNPLYYNKRIAGAETLSGGYLPSSSYSSENITSYTVDSNGDITFPILGKVHVEGLRREEVASTIQQKLVESNQVKDPVVMVEFTNLGVSVLGEVKTPGRFRLDKDRFTILDAISVAGDLTIYGDRHQVLVIRKGPEGDLFYKMDLTNGQNIYSSPGFFLQQGDVVYVTPNKKRAGDSSVNGNTVKSASFWVSVASLLTSAAVLVNNIVRANNNNGH